MNDLNENSPTLFSKLLQVRTAFKTISQISWSVSQLEKRYPLETLSDEQISSLINAYYGHMKPIEEAMEMLKKLKNEDELADNEYVKKNK